MNIIKFKTLSCFILIGASIALTVSADINEQTNLTVISNVISFYNIPNFPNPTVSAEVANLQANPQNYIDSTIIVPMNNADFDVYTNNYSTPIIMTESGSPVLKSESAPNAPIGFNILYTPCGNSSAAINVNNQCTGNGCVLPPRQTQLSSCGGVNSKAHGNIQYVLKTPNTVLGNGLYSVSPDYLITFQTGF